MWERNPKRRVFLGCESFYKQAKWPHLSKYSKRKQDQPGPPRSLYLSTPDGRPKPTGRVDLLEPRPAGTHTALSVIIGSDAFSHSVGVRTSVAHGRRLRGKGNRSGLVQAGRAGSSSTVGSSLLSRQSCSSPASPPRLTRLVFILHICLSFGFKGETDVGGVGAHGHTVT